MRPSGQLQLGLWRARLELRKSNLLRRVVRSLRDLLPDTRERHLRGEVRFWRKWVRSKGLVWPEDYRARLDPASPVQEHLARVIDRLPGSRVELLDVGAGPATVIGKVHPSKELVITATDPLADQYNAVLAQFGVEPPVQTIFGEAEDLSAQLGGRQFDIVHAQNSLDHSADPFAGIEEMLALTRPGGFVVLLHEENEGRNELYHALHKWDFRDQGGRFIIAGPGPGGPARDVTEMVGGRARVECSHYAGELLVLMEKLPARKGAGPPRRRRSVTAPDGSRAT